MARETVKKAALARRAQEEEGGRFWDYEALPGSRYVEGQAPAPRTPLRPEDDSSLAWETWARGTGLRGSLRAPEQEHSQPTTASRADVKRALASPEWVLGAGQAADVERAESRRKGAQGRYQQAASADVERAASRRKGAEVRYQQKIGEEKDRIDAMLARKSQWGMDPKQMAVYEDFLRMYGSAKAGNKKLKQLGHLREDVWNKVERFLRKRHSTQVGWAKKGLKDLTFQGMSEKEFDAGLRGMKNNPEKRRELILAMNRDYHPITQQAKAEAPLEGTPVMQAKAGAPPGETPARVEAAPLWHSATKKQLSLIHAVLVAQDKYDKELEEIAWKKANLFSGMEARRIGARGRRAPSRYAPTIPEGKITSWRQLFTEEGGRRPAGKGTGIQWRGNLGRAKGFTDYQKALNWLKKKKPLIGYHAQGTGKSGRQAKVEQFLRLTSATPDEVLALANGLRTNRTQDQYQQGLEVQAALQAQYSKEVGGTEYGQRHERKLERSFEQRVALAETKFEQRRSIAKEKLDADLLKMRERFATQEEIDARKVKYATDVKKYFADRERLDKQAEREGHTVRLTRRVDPLTGEMIETETRTKKPVPRYSPDETLPSYPAPLAPLAHRPAQPRVYERGYPSLPARGNTHDKFGPTVMKLEKPGAYQARINGILDMGPKDTTVDHKQWKKEILLIYNDQRQKYFSGAR